MLEDIVNTYLREHGHATVEEWAIVTMGYWYDDDYDVWFNDESEPVDIELKFIQMLDENHLLDAIDEEVF